MASITGSDSEETSSDTDESLPSSDQLLKYSRNGVDSKVENLLNSSQDVTALVNCKGMQ